jgi:hypothetical protein
LGTKLKTERGFRFINRFSVGFLFRNQILNENGKSTGFLVYNSVFLFFQKNQKLNFLNCNRPIFGELKKPVRIGFVGFHENRPVFVDIVIHYYIFDLFKRHSVKLGRVRELEKNCVQPYCKSTILLSPHSEFTADLKKIPRESHFFYINCSSGKTLHHFPRRCPQLPH